MKLGKLNKNRKAQEEMVGFVIIVIIVFVILLVLLVFMLKKPNEESLKNYEVENFLQAALQYTSSCGTYIDYLAVQDLIVSCEQEDICINGENSCDILNDTLKGLVENAWSVGNQTPVKGYKLKVMAEDREIFSLQKGNETRSYKGGMADFPYRGERYELTLSVYS